MSPLVSILIPSYNAQEWIVETLQSALGQTWANKEIIVVDDGSTDETLSMARQFASRGVLVVPQKNQGAAAARNRAYSLCHGDYIQWLDADDLLAPDKISTQMDVVRQCRSKRMLFSAAWGRFYYRSQKARFTASPLWCNLSPVEYLLRKIGQNCFMQTSAWLVSRELSDAAGPWDTRLLGDDDGEYFCRVLAASDGVEFVPESKVFYRTPGYRRLSHIGNSPRKIEAQFVSMQLHIRYLRSLEDSERVRAACLWYLQAWLICFYPDRMDIVAAARQMALELGGQLTTPRMELKYAWIQRLVGWGLAKRTRLVAQEWRRSAERFFDKALYRLQ